MASLKGKTGLDMGRQFIALKKIKHPYSQMTKKPF